MRKFLLTLLLLLPMAVSAQDTTDIRKAFDIKPNVIIPSLKLDTIPVVKPKSNKWVVDSATDAEAITLNYPELPDTVNARVFSYSPSLIYKKWWMQIEACTNLFIPVSQQQKVKWFYAVAPFFYMTGDASHTPADGVTLPWNDAIIIVFQGIETEMLVKHEMIHYLMYENGMPPGHPSALFGKCITLPKP